MRSEVIAGEYLDVVGAAGDGSVANALTVVRLKTARYTVTRPVQIGAALAGATPEEVAALAGFGDPLGDAFQLRDDVLGVFGDPAVTGKSDLDDLREGKPTVLLALARASASPAGAARLRELVGDPGLDQTARGRGAGHRRGVRRPGGGGADDPLPGPTAALVALDAVRRWRSRRGGCWRRSWNGRSTAASDTYFCRVSSESESRSIRSYGQADRKVLMSCTAPLFRRGDRPAPPASAR